METISLYSFDKEKAIWISNMSFIFLIYDGFYISENDHEIIFSVSYNSYRIYTSFLKSGDKDYTNFTKQFDDTKFKSLYNLSKVYSFDNIKYCSINSLDYYSYIYLKKAFDNIKFENIFTSFEIFNKSLSILELNMIFTSTHYCHEKFDACNKNLDVSHSFVSKYFDDKNLYLYLIKTIKKSTFQKFNLILSLNSKQFNYIFSNDLFSIISFDTIICFLIDIIETDPINHTFVNNLKAFTYIECENYSLLRKIV